jgi:indolepyruvate ferredoxin oxidoreductase beta subunit
VPIPVTASRPRPVSILIAALGGQGGGVLTEWIVGAAAHAGLPVQATSIPGVAQRTGATTYYVEVFPQALPPGAAEPVFSLYPAPGDVDVIVASELLEAGRALEMDYASPERTTLVASTHRLFAIGEKSALGHGVFPAERIEAAARQLARRLVAFDALAAARSAGSEVNAVLLGALAATGVLPLAEAAYEAAIREQGVAVERNLAGFRAGGEIVLAGEATLGGAVGASPPWAVAKAERAAALGRRGAAFLAVAAAMEAEFAPSLHRTLGEALARLVDYQDAVYAERFLERVRRVRANDPGPGDLTEAFARRLAVWMTYEDAIRVADLKTRRGRLDRIRRESGAGPGEVVVVTDYLKPDLDEIYGILPVWIAAPIARWAERRWPERRPGLAQHVRTTSIMGFLRVWALGRLRVLRPSSLRFQRESALMSRWEEAVLRCATLDAGLAREVVEAAAVVKGYGDVRRRMIGALERLLGEVLPVAIESARAVGEGYGRAARTLGEARRLVLTDEHGIEAVDALLGGARGAAAGRGGV